MLKMVKPMLEQESAVRIVLSADRKVSHLIPSWQDISQLTLLFLYSHHSLTSCQEISKKHDEDQQASSSSTSASLSIKDQRRKEIEDYLRTLKLDFEEDLLL